MQRAGETGSRPGHGSKPEGSPIIPIITYHKRDPDLTLASTILELEKLQEKMVEVISTFKHLHSYFTWVSKEVSRLSKEIEYTSLVPELANSSSELGDVTAIVGFQPEYTYEPHQECGLKFASDLEGYLAESREWLHHVRRGHRHVACQLQMNKTMSEQLLAHLEKSPIQPMEVINLD
jgi:hypothetical protein